jgi:hypothetical protein
LELVALSTDMNLKASHQLHGDRYSTCSDGHAFFTAQGGFLLPGLAHPPAPHKQPATLSGRRMSILHLVAESCFAVCTLCAFRRKINHNPTILKMRLFCFLFMSWGIDELKCSTGWEYLLRSCGEFLPGSACHLS